LRFSGDFVGLISWDVTSTSPKWIDVADLVIWDLWKCGLLDIELKAGRESEKNEDVKGIWGSNVPGSDWTDAVVRVGDKEIDSLVGIVAGGPRWFTEIERGVLARRLDAEDGEVILDESEYSSPFELKNGAGLGLDGNLLVVTHLTRESGTSGGAGSTDSVCDVLDCFSDRAIVNGCGVRLMLSLLSLVADLHSSSQAGNIWSTHSHPSGLLKPVLKLPKSGQRVGSPDSKSGCIVVVIRAISPVLRSSSLIKWLSLSRRNIIQLMSGAWNV
jgi:hypothetical protein